MLGGTNSLHTNALDETLALPSEQAAEIALRTQQVIMEETGVINVADPLGGSWYVEALTDKIEAEANAIFEKILCLGGSSLTATDHAGLAKATAAAARSRSPGACCAASRTAGSCPRSPRRPSSTRRRWRRATRRSSASTCTSTRSPTTSRSCGSRHEVEVEQVRELKARKAPATPPSIEAAIAVVEVAHTEENMIPAMLDAARAEAILSEICDALRAEWGEYREPARF